MFDRENRRIEQDQADRVAEEILNRRMGRKPGEEYETREPSEISASGSILGLLILASPLLYVAYVFNKIKVPGDNFFLTLLKTIGYILDHIISWILM